VQRNANVVVLGKDTREALFKDASGLGEVIHINGIPFTVIGEYEVKGKMLGNNFDQVATVPYTTIDKYFPAPNDAPPWFPKRGELFLDAIAQTPEQSELAQQQIIETLRIRRHLPSNKGNNFVVFTDDAFLALYNAVTGGIFALMALISSISLFVGGIGVMNIMLVAVTERTREIGVRRRSAHRARRSSPSSCSKRWCSPARAGRSGSCSARPSRGSSMPRASCRRMCRRGRC
jgi:putative ABC transport system permease protein